MQHWLQLGTRNWRVKPFRAAAVVLAVALGVAIVVTVTTIYASVETAVAEDILHNWVGRAHVSIESPLGHWGNVEQGLLADLETIPGVVRTTARLKTRMHVTIPLTAGPLPRGTYETRGQYVPVDVVGIDPAAEYEFRQFSRLRGRRIQPGDRGAVILDEQLAGDLDLAIGDTLRMTRLLDDDPQAFTIVGLAPSRRVALFQKPTLYLPLDEAQAMAAAAGKVSVIDLMVEPAEPAAIESVAAQVRTLLNEKRFGYLVSTGTLKLNQLLGAQRTTRTVLLLFASIALLTSFFIIITTMSMGMMERIRQLGTIRCVGATRGQLASLVGAEVLPLGLLGTLLGLPMGYGLVTLALKLVENMQPSGGSGSLAAQGGEGEWALVLPEITISRWGLVLAVIGGMLTTLAGIGALLYRGAAVSPMRAVTPEARGSRRRHIVLAAMVGVVLLLVNEWMVRELGEFTWFRADVVFLATATLYGGYMCLAPLVVCLVGNGAVVLVAPLLRVRRRLVQDQVVRTPWRSAGVCWALMVGLSLIVYFFVQGESIVHAWNFPAHLAGTFVWSNVPMPRSVVDEVAVIPGVSGITPINDVICRIRPKRANLISLLSTRSVFAAGDPDTFLNLSRVEYLQGDPEEARAKLARGGYVLLPPEAAHAFGYGLGDKVPVTIGSKTVAFEVAGVVRSPAMDIAVAYFGADSYMMLASASSVLGTLADLKKHFNLDEVKMFMMNIAPPEVEPPPAGYADAPPARATADLLACLPKWADYLPLERDEIVRVLPDLQAAASGNAPMPRAANSLLRRLRYAINRVTPQWHALTPRERWQVLQEEMVVARIKDHVQRPGAMTGSLLRIKQRIDADIRKATMVLAGIPLVALLVASLGVANLMIVNVNSRAPQIAVLRAVGATRALIARLVMVEALVLGVLGTLLGVLLGMHAARSEQVLIDRFVGIEVPWVVPWDRIALAVVVTCVICLLAGIAPAVRAARRNIAGSLAAS